MTSKVSVRKQTSPNFAQAMGKRILFARRAAGLSQKELAKALHISDKAISSYEVGRSVPSMETLKKISTIVKKPFTYFDDDQSVTDLTLSDKIARIERELIEIKELLKKRA